MNPMDMMQFASRFSLFNQQHPKFGMFIKSVANKGIEEGAVMEVKFTSPDGQEYVSNIRLTADDIQTIEMIKGMGRR